MACLSLSFEMIRCSLHWTLPNWLLGYCSVRWLDSLFTNQWFSKSYLIDTYRKAWVLVNQEWLRTLSADSLGPWPVREWLIGAMTFGKPWGLSAHCSHGGWSPRDSNWSWVSHLEQVDVDRLSDSDSLQVSHFEPVHANHLGALTNYKSVT